MKVNTSNPFGRPGAILWSPNCFLQCPLGVDSSLRHHVPLRSMKNAIGTSKVGPPEDQAERTGNSRLGPREDQFGGSGIAKGIGGFELDNAPLYCTCVRVMCSAESLKSVKSKGLLTGAGNMPVIVWAEEGASTGEYQSHYSKPGYSPVRCVRNLGMPFPTSSSIVVHLSRPCYLG